MTKTLEQKLCCRSLGYSFVRNFFVRPLLFFFYKKIDIIGANDVPDSGPVIFTPNHQNALMDALAILCTKDRQPVFVARADIFQKPLIIAILHFLRILPIYRKRDGGNSSDNNQETFDMIVKVLRSKHAVGVMPEGTHNEIKRLRTLQKGIFKLAMQVQEEHGNIPTVKIIPVGIEYTSTNKFRSDLIVNYGKAIELSDFYDLYVKNPARAFKQMQDTLSEKMKEGMINIDNEQHYSEIERMRVLYQNQSAHHLGLDCRKAEHRLQAQQKIIASLQTYDQANPKEMSVLCDMVKKYLNIIKKYELDDWTIERQPFSMAGLLGRCLLIFVGLPVWITGMIFNYIPYKLSDVFSRKVKDPQFVSSVQFVTGLVLYPLYYLIMIVLLVILVPCIWGKLIIPFLMPALGVFVYNYYLFIKNLFTRFRFYQQRKKPEILQAIDLRKNIFERLDKIITQ